ncbi:Thioesterase/thiol ester dehydrase-isomerase [Hypoxylon rubiginosum]|uniref:Thioesterase/thiol ester dehydrase-isomerase n=1 Tax=Hypoxylon rubiginosum TaxID=110542 RepID=A0ACB9ZDZ9_9PEZI|nr:Thioesterase/thiol ester dehydrase-isomerase [Hypoxylon rubiginosum]
MEFALAKPHSAPADHNQSVPDPLAHFKAIPWCAALLADRAVVSIVVPDRRPLPTGESNFVRKTMNSPTTVRASVSFMRVVRPAATTATPRKENGDEKKNKKDGEENKKQNQKKKPPSKSEPLLSGGGPANGEDPRNPFLLFNALADLGGDCTSYVGTMHGGLYGVLMDEVMGTAANFQSEHGAYTVSFTTRFRRAVSPPEIVLIRGRVVRKEGRKLHLRGTIEDKDGNIMAEGEGLWIAMSKNVGRSQL